MTPDPSRGAVTGVATLAAPPHLPDDNWTSLGTVAAYMYADWRLLGRQAEQLGIQLDRSAGPGPASIRSGDLARLVGPVAARAIRHLLESFGPEAVAAMAGSGGPL